MDKNQIEKILLHPKIKDLKARTSLLVAYENYITVNDDDDSIHTEGLIRAKIPYDMSVTAYVLYPDMNLSTDEIVERFIEITEINLKHLADCSPERYNLYIKPKTA